MSRNGTPTTHRDATASGRTGWTPGQVGYPTPARGPRWTTGGLLAAALLPALVALTAFAPLATAAATATLLALVGGRNTAGDAGPPGGGGRTEGD